MLKQLSSIIPFLIIPLVIISCTGKKSNVSSEKPEVKTPVAEATSPSPVPKAQPAPESSSPIEVITSFTHLDSIIKNTPNALLIFDLYADWCKPCKMLAPIYSSLAKKHSGKARFFRVDVQKHRDIAQAFRVNGIPLVVFMKDNEIVHAITGLRPPEQYEMVITSCGASVSKDECHKKLEAAL